MKIKKMVYLLLCVMFFILQLPVSAAPSNVKYSVGVEDAVQTGGLVDYARLPDVSASAESWNSQSYTPMQALVEHENYFWYAASGQYSDALTVNLNRAVSAKYIQLLMLRRYSGSYDGVKVEYSTDGVNYTEACVSTETISEDAWLNIEFISPADMQYVRISNANYNRPAVKYVKVWGEEDSSLDVTNAADGNVSDIDASPHIEAYTADLMFDNEYAKASAYVSAQASSAPFVTVRLAVPAVITAVALCPHTDFEEGAGNFTISLSKDGASWTEAAALTDDAKLSFGSMNIIKTGITEECSYVRITKIENDSGSYPEGSLAFAEMKLVSDLSLKRFWVKGFQYNTNPAGLYANDGDFASDLKIEFSETIDPETVNCDSIQLIRDGVRHAFTFTVEDNTVIIPQNQFQSNSEYEIVVTADVSAADSTPLIKSTSQALTTGTIYNIINDGKSRLINALLNKPVQYNKVIGLYGTSTEEDLKQINDGSNSAGSILPSSPGTVYYFIDMMNMYEVVSITLAERSLGYQTDTGNAVVAGSMTMPPLKADGTIDVAQMDTIYSVSSPLDANEVRTISLDEVKPYRYLALYRAGGSALCFTEFGATAKAEVNSTDGWKISNTVNGDSTSFDIELTAEVYAQAGIDAKLLITAFDEKDKLIFMELRDAAMQYGSNAIHESVSIPSARCVLRTALVERKDGMRMLFDGIEKISK